MNRHTWLRVAVGSLLLALAVGVTFTAVGVGAASTAFRHSQAQWQRGLSAPPAAAPGRGQRLGELLLGIAARSDVLRAYQDYRAGIANVIPGTVYPQTQARWEAESAIQGLRPSLSAADRASADVALGVIFTAGAAASGQQRSTQTRYAIQSFQRAVTEDPANATAKLDLEVLLRSELDRAKARARAEARASTSPPNRRRQPQQDPRGPTPPRAAGTGY